MVSLQPVKDSTLTTSSNRVRVWDPVIRTFHWFVALGVLAELTVLREIKTAHLYVGYAVAAALGLRILWGLIGTRHARFVDFVPSPPRLLEYLKRLRDRNEPRYVGHNPAGAVMMLLLMALIAIMGVTGWMMGTDAFWGVEWVEGVHEATANIIIAAVVLHVIGALVESFRHHENLPLAMVTGYKRAATGTDIDHADIAGRG